MDYIKESAIRFCNAQRACSDCKYGDCGADECLVMSIARAREPERTISEIMAWAKAHKDDKPRRREDIFGDMPERAVVAEYVADGIAKILEDLLDLESIFG